MAALSVLFSVLLHFVSCSTGDMAFGREINRPSRRITEKSLTDISSAEYYSCRGESAALGRHMPWANRRFSKSMKGKILNFLHEVEKMISVIAVQV